MTEPATEPVDPDIVAATTDVATGAAEPTARSERIAADRARARAMFIELAAMGPDDPRRARLRDELVEIHLPLVEYLARRFRNRGEPLDDLVQVATIGLIKSVDRFDLERAVEFSTYATPTIEVRSSGTSATRAGRSGSPAACRSSSSA